MIITLRTHISLSFTWSRSHTLLFFRDENETLGSRKSTIKKKKKISESAKIKIATLDDDGRDRAAPTTTK